MAARTMLNTMSALSVMSTKGKRLEERWRIPVPWVVRSHLHSSWMRFESRHFLQISLWNTALRCLQLIMLDSCSDMFPGSQIVKEYSCAQTKATELIKCCANDIVMSTAARFQTGPFTVGTDGSQEGGEKCYWWWCGMWPPTVNSTQNWSQIWPEPSHQLEKTFSVNEQDVWQHYCWIEKLSVAGVWQILM